MNSPDKENRCPHPHLHLLSLKSLSDPELCPLSEPEEDPDTDTDDDANMKSSEAEDVKAVPSSGAKAKTLQPLARLAAGNSLKRSITLPRNPFASAGSSRSSSAPPQAANNNNNQAAKKAKSNSAENGHAPSANNSAQLKSVKNFFNRFVTQIQLNSRNGIKFGDGSRDSHGWKKRLEEGKVPGVIGIRNHGNTCFINAILQCLSYTDILAEYFVLDQYKSDLKRKRRIASLTHFSKRTGHKGEVTEQLATLLKSLWSLQYDPEISIRFKSLVEKHASQYKGGSQHDAQEFLLWLLDQVHEDLNTATKRKYKTKVASKGSSGAASSGAAEQRLSDETLAAESLASYMRCNNSFVMDVFQAQFRSSLTCPTCERQSNTFDPFLCVSLPIPQKQLLPVFVNVLYIDQSPRQVKIGLTVGVHETIAELRKVLSKDTGIAEPQTLLCQIDPVKGFQRTLRDSQPVTVLKECGGGSHPLYCVEVPKHKESSEDDGAFVVLTWTNVLKEGPIEKRFGSPYSIQVSRETLYSDLQKLLMKEMASILHEDILISAQKVPLFKIRVLDGFEESVSYLDSTVDLPMYTEAVEQAINLCTLEPGGGPAHVKLILEWDAPAKSQIIADDRDVVEEHSSVKEVEKSPDEATVVTLQECFSLYTSAEKLGQGDAWLCPACNRKQEVVKRMGLWSVPDVLVVHLKRFRQSNSSTNKLTTMVDFPLEGFDMSPNVTKSPGSSSGNSTSSTESTTTTNSHLKMFNALSPWKHPKRFPQTRSDEDYTYELYAVCNHHGSDLQGGHYTAFCKNPTDGQWYCFDDMHTKPITEQEVLSQDAYILFYQRQSLGAGSGSSASSSSSSGSSTNPEHWVFRMPDFNYKKKVGTGTTGTTASTTTTTTTAASAKTVAAAKSTKVANQSQVSASESKTSSKAGLSDSKDTKDYEKSKETKEKAEDKTETSSFVRNSAKYATLPTKRTSDIIECDVDHHSDIEPGSPDEEDFEEEDEIAIEKQKHKEEEKRAKEKAKAIEEADEDEDDVSRPIDKNDVD